MHDAPKLSRVRLVSIQPAANGVPEHVLAREEAVVGDESSLQTAWQTVFQINKNLFHSGPILVQRFVTEARHIETQILADKHGHVVVLGERECSVQRRNQKVIEEAPSPALTDEERALMRRYSGRSPGPKPPSSGTA
jgi:acetyl/propionyl-CoA carboxylase alpha subunit